MAAFGGGLGFLNVRRVPGIQGRRSGSRWAIESEGWRGPCLSWSTGRDSRHPRRVCPAGSARRTGGSSHGLGVAGQAVACAAPR